MTILRVACIQVNAGPDLALNLAAAASLVRAAQAQGAELAVLPENTGLIVKDRAERFLRSFPEDHHPAVPFFADLARETGLWIVVGSIAVIVGEEKLANRCLVFAPDGSVAARYDKIHLFDVDLDKGESYRESENFRAGDRAALATTPWGKIGLTICYDLRFAALFRALAKAGAGIITVPAAFTVPTGQAHWHVLLRARAIETGCFVLAPAQCGAHDGGRQTYGHSLIISPWGEILAEAGEEPGIILADLNLDDVTRVRRMIPSLQHDRDFAAAAQPLT